MAQLEENVHAKIIAKAWSDPDFKARLMKDPHAALREEGVAPLTDAKIIVHENSADEVHYVLPAPPVGDALSQEDLQRIAGGHQVGTYPSVGCDC